LEPIQFFNRHTGQLETEAVYGEKALRRIYETLPGKLALETVAKRAFFSKTYGWFMSRPSSKDRVQPFIAKYGLDEADFLEPASSYPSFNAFFTRKLKPTARPIADSAVVFPADGRHLGFADISQCPGFFVKGQQFDLAAFLGNDPALTAKFGQGTLVLSRLCPVDYHRFHFPVAGVAGAPRLLNGPLYSVSPIALRQRLAYLWENKRVLTLLETEQLGTVAIVEIGATNVGSIVQTYKPGHVEKGQEKGYFEFGGSSTITIFEQGRVKLAEDLLAHSAVQRELYVKMGQAMAAG
jgi:phosphatidylserine decarboxylase